LDKRKRHITVFEHQTLKVNQVIDEVEFDAQTLKALQHYYGEKGVPYFSLTHNGVRFNEYVGVIQAGAVTIEVLPKADAAFAETDEKKTWHNILIDMLFAVGVFDIHAPSSSSLKLKPNSILDLYFELFIREVEYLVHAGLVKQYRKKEANVSALKGSLQFGKHIQHNLTHQERFYVRHTVYDVEHKLHLILYKTICLLKQLNTNQGLHSRIGALLLHFPEMPPLKVTEATFSTLPFSRKTQSYKTAISIARMLLLHYHPDVSQGRNNVLALMFDMNLLWEQFVYVSLRKNASMTVTAQSSRHFWESDTGTLSKMRPDIWIQKGEESFVLDTKWKNLNGKNPSPEDLRQMYVYHEYYSAKKVALVYPGSEKEATKGIFISPHENIKSEKECSIISISVPRKTEDKKIVKNWQKSIEDKFIDWMHLPIIKK
jgi:5-methylcytosine-specific restriction enzyme subunit McrC